MAQQENLSLESIMNELYRVDELEKENSSLKEKVEEQAAVIDKLGKDTQEVKEKAGIDEGGKEKNVIGSEKLPATLTTSEKKRYQNIGKEFIDGAGDQFQKILKAVKFKSMMSTMREKFTAGIDKIKGFVKKAKEKKWFFAKLLLIVTLLGVIIHHFKEKILGVIPNLSEYINDLFKAGKLWIKDCISSTMDWIGNQMSEMFNGIFEKSFDYLKDFVNVFFTDTLPNTIVELYLRILSSFSDDAEMLLDKDDTNLAYEQANSIVDLGEVQATEINETKNYLKSTEKLYNTFVDDINSGRAFDMNSYKELYSQVGVLAMNDADGSQKDNLYDIIKSVTTIDSNIEDMINRGDIDATMLIQKLKESQDDNKITQQEIVDAINSSMNPLKERIELKMKNKGNEVVSNVKGITQIVELADKKRSELLNYKKEFEEKTEQKQKDVENIKRTVTSIKAAEVITEALEEAFISLIETIKKFIKGNSISNAIQSALKETNTTFISFVGSFEKFVNNFVEKFKTSIFDGHTYLTALYEKMENYAKIINGAEKKENQQNENTPPNFVLNVGVEFVNDNGVNGVTQLALDAIAIDEQLNSTLRKSNESLREVLDILKSVEVTEEQKTLKDVQKLNTNFTEWQGAVSQKIKNMDVKDAELKGDISKINAKLENLGKANNAASDPAAESAVGLY